MGNNDMRKMICADFSSPAIFPDEISCSLKEGKIHYIHAPANPSQMLNNTAVKEYEKVRSTVVNEFKKFCNATIKEFQGPVSTEEYEKILSTQEMYENIKEHALEACENIIDDTFWAIFANPVNRVEEWK